LEGNRRSGGK